jgi:hypothetical protein
MIRGLGTLALLLVIGCADAPHDNPLDPLSPDYSGEGMLSGTITVKDRDIPVSSAQIRVLEDAVAVTSDSLGRYSFRRLTPGTATVVCTKDNFSPDTQRVALTSGGAQSLNFALNGAPVVLSQEILTRKVDQYYPSPQYFVDVSADVTDPNGITDLDSVYFGVTSLLFPMTYDLTTKQFQVRVFKYDLPTNTIEWLVGKPLTIVSRDRSGARNTGEAFYVSRVIETGATPVYPSSLNNDTTSGTPLLKWSAPAVTFSFTYTLGMSRIDAGIPTPIWAVANINSQLSEYQYSGTGSEPPLSAGNYAWTVTVVDEFGNSSRSKESSFVVQ